MILEGENKMNFITKIRLNMKRKALIQAQEELKLLRLLNEKTAEEKRIKEQINHAKGIKKKPSITDDEESSFIGKEYPNYDSP